MNSQTSQTSMELRPRKRKIELTNNFVTKNGKLEMPKPILKSRSTFQKNGDVNVNIFESRITAIENDIFEIKKTQKIQSEANSNFASQIHNESKSNHFQGIIKDLKNELNALILASEVTKMVRYHNGEFLIQSNKSYDFDFDLLLINIIEMNNKIEQINLKHAAFETEAKLKINELLLKEKSNCESIVDLAMHVNSMESNDCEKIQKDNCDESFSSMSNAIEYIQFDLNKVNLLMHKDEEKIILMNNQLHVLSAKFIDFKAKINNFILNINQKKKSSKCSG